MEHGLIELLVGSVAVLAGHLPLLFDLDGAGSPAFSQRAASVARNYQDPTLAQPKQKPFAPEASSRISPSNVALTGPTYGTVN